MCVSCLLTSAQISVHSSANVSSLPFAFQHLPPFLFHSFTSHLFALKLSHLPWLFTQKHIERHRRVVSHRYIHPCSNKPTHKYSQNHSSWYTGSLWEQTTLHIKPYVGAQISRPIILCTLKKREKIGVGFPCKHFTNNYKELTSNTFN